MYRLLQEGGKTDTIKTVSDLLIQTRKGVSTIKSAAAGNKSDEPPVYSYTSAAKASSKLVAVFPVLMSRTVSAATAQMITKYVEQKGCIFLQMALQQANVSDAKTGIEYLHQYHQNLNVGGGGAEAVSKMLDAWLDGVVGESTQHKTYAGYLAEQARKSEEDDSICYGDFYLFENDVELDLSKRDMEELLAKFSEAENAEFYDLKLNPISINEYAVREFEDGTYHVSITAVGRELLNEAKRTNGNGSVMDRVNQTSSAVERAKAEREQKEKEAEREAEQKAEKATQKAEEEKRRKEEEQTRLQSTKSVVTPLRDQEIKKANAALPSLLVVKFYNKETTAVATEFIIGVKAKMIGVTSDEILRRIANDNRDGKKFLNLMRTITGELKASDFLLGIASIKDDVKSTRRKGAYGDVWELLKTRAVVAQQRVKNHQNNDYAAITTVVISQDDADALYKEENLDINDPKVALHFMKSYDLMGFAICDDSTESVKIIFDDGDNFYDELAYATLEKDTDGGAYKKLINLMAASR